MQNLCNQLTKQKCQHHQLPLERICIEANCKHEQRGMCWQCPKQDNLFGFLQEQFQYNKTQQQAELKPLFQQFANCKAVIVGKMNKLQTLLESLNISIQRNLEVELSERGFFKRFLHERDTQALEDLFSKVIQVIHTDQFQLKQVDVIQNQDSYQEVAQLLEQFNNISRQLNDKLCVIQYIDQTQLHVNSEYKQTQQIDLQSHCSQVCLNNDETQLAVASGSSIIIFNLSSNGLWIQEQSELMGTEVIIFSIKFNHNSTQLVSSGQNTLIQIWNKQLDETWLKQDELNKYTVTQLSACFNHDVTILASGTFAKKIYIYVVSNGNWEFNQMLGGHTSYVYDICFNNDSTLLASGSDDKSIIIWEFSKVGNWYLKEKLTGHKEIITKLSFNSVSTQLVSGSKDNTIKIWSIDNQKLWQCIDSLVGHSGTLRSVQFNQESNIIVSSGEDKLIKLWKIDEHKNWKCQQTINQHNDNVICVIISSDSSIVISGSFDQTIMIYQIIPE